MAGRIGIRELNQQTSQMLERVRRGETLIVTDRGQAIARLVPIGDPDSVLDRLVSQGQMIPPRLRGPFPAAVEFGAPEVDSTAVVSDLREEL